MSETINYIEGELATYKLANKSLENEVESLKAEIERLRASAQKVVDETKKARSSYMSMPFAAVIAIDKLEKLLETK